MNALQKRDEEEFEKSLPMGRQVFKELFDHLDLEFGEQGCDHTCKLTETFLIGRGIQNIPAVMQWLDERGGHCDCEVLANVEEAFQ